MRLLLLIVHSVQEKEERVKTLESLVAQGLRMPAQPALRSQMAGRLLDERRRMNNHNQYIREREEEEWQKVTTFRMSVR